MSHLAAYEAKTSFDWKLFSLYLDSLESPLPGLNLPSPHFALFLACDGRTIPDAAALRFARKMVEQGAVYICVWGPECERIHDLFDDVAVMLEVDEGRDLPLMTTWHDDESLDEALWFMLNVAHPDERYADTCGSGLAVSVACLEWNERIRGRLLNLSQLDADVVSEG